MRRCGPHIWLSSAPGWDDPLTRLFTGFSDRVGVGVPEIAKKKPFILSYPSSVSLSRPFRIYLAPDTDSVVTVRSSQRRGLVVGGLKSWIWGLYSSWGQYFYTL